MLTIKNIQKNITLILIIVGSVIIISCELEVTPNETIFYENNALKERVKTNIEEAKVLSRLAIINKEAILITQLVNGRPIGTKAMLMSNTFETQQKDMERLLIDLAKKKLVLLPNKVDENDIMLLKEIKDENFLIAYQKKIIALLKSEIEEFNYLATITNDVDFKVLSDKTLKSLHTKLVEIKNISTEH